jgi:predicted nucleic acid-binding protein
VNQRWVVVDSGLFIAYLLPESLSQQAQAAFHLWEQGGMRLAAPALLQYEVIAVLRKNVYRNLLTSIEAVNARDTFFKLLPTIYVEVDAALLRRGLELATQFNRPTAYDSQYLAVAERLGCDFWTADERLFNATTTRLSWVRWLGHIAP